MPYCLLESNRSIIICMLDSADSVALGGTMLEQHRVIIVEVCFN